MTVGKQQTQALDIFLREYSFGSVPRILLTLEGFYSTHGHWPTIVDLDREMAEANREQVLTERGWNELQKKVTLRFEVKGTVIAQDDDGLRYEYGDDVPKGRKAPKADVWLWGCDLRG